MYKKFLEPGTLESKSKCIRFYKILCFLLMLVCLISLVICVVELIIHIGLSVYYIVSVGILIFESILFYLEVRAIHNSDLSLQNTVIRLSLTNVILLTVWEFLGGGLLESWHLGVSAGIASFIISGLFLLCNIMVRKSLEGKSLSINRSDFN